MRVVVVETDEQYEDALDVRRAVFVAEQGVPEEMEVDDHEDEATHFVAYDEDGEPIGAARLREYGPGVGKVERVAVLQSRRGEGVGAALMDAVEREARGRFDDLYLHAQLPVEGFYAERGYEREGDEFEEAGIPHVAMRLSLGE
jgi:predicted GNAT family N-acyltransferase